MKICDVCNTPTVALTELQSQYKSEGISELCEACEAWANQYKSKLVAKICEDTRDALIAKKGAPPAEKRVWWRILT